MIDLKAGDRVHITGHWNWPNDCTGVVAKPADAVRQRCDDEPWQGVIRYVRGRTGMIPFVCIEFDAPQRDGDGDGPYRGGEVELEFVRRR